MTPRTRGQISATPPPVLLQGQQQQAPFPLTTSYYPFPNVVKVNAPQAGLSVVSAPAPVMHRPDISTPTSQTQLIANGTASLTAPPVNNGTAIVAAGKGAIVIPSTATPAMDALNGLKTGKTHKTGVSSLTRVKQLQLHDQQTAVFS